MKSTDKMFISKLNEIKGQLENVKNVEDIESELKQIFDSVVSENSNSDNKGKYCFEKEKGMDIFAIDERISLCKSVDDDKSFYLKLQKENTIMPSAYALEGFEDMLWDEMKEEKAFYTTIRRNTDNAYMGYCGIKNIYKDEMELVIEILKEYHNQGYGSEALRLYMEQVSVSTGIRRFKALVDGENIASQAMCEKIGGVPSGISEHLLHDQKYMEEYEKENHDEITDQLRVVAKKFDIQPEKLLTHVLVYRFEL